MKLNGRAMGINLGRFGAGGVSMIKYFARTSQEIKVS
jgi:predicted DNA-binding WGR domain protein